MMTYREELEHITELLNSHPTFVSKEHIENELLPGTVIAAVIVTAIFALAMFGVKKAAPNCDNNFLYKASYQITNLVVNASLGVLGAYYFSTLCGSDDSLDEWVLGYKAIYPMACAQLGYNLWAIPVGIFLVKESPAMLGHHISVIVVTSMSAFFTLGYNWFAPFMFGILELSSVPLAIMNSFKENPEYIKKYPSAYTAIRIIFAFTFLYIRWHLYLPLKYDFLRTFGMAVLNHPSTFARWYCGAAWIASFFLLILQLLWGFMIVKGLIKLALPGKKKKKKADDKKEK
jgi:hypothetical protein